MTSPSSQLVGLVAGFCARLGLQFDRSLAQRAYLETIAADGTTLATGEAVRAIGSLVNLRIQSEHLSLGDVRRLAGNQIPVGALLETGDWLLVTAARGSKFLVTTTEGDQGRWVNVRDLMNMLGLNSKDDKRSWLIARNALLDDEAGIFGALSSPPGQHLKPFARLLRLMRVEKRDLWTIFIFTVVISLLALTTPLAIEALVNTVAWGRYLQPIIVLSLMVFAFLIFSALLNAITTYVVEILQRRLFVRIVDDLAFRIPRVQQTALDGEYAPELVNRFFDIMTVQKAMPKLLMEGLSLVIQTFVGLAVLAFYHPWLLGYDIALLAAMNFVIFVLGRGAVQTAIKESKAKYQVASWLEEIARHPTAFKLNGGQGLGLNRMDQLVVHYLDYKQKHFRILLRQILFSWILYAVAATTLLGLGGWLVVSGELTLGQLVAAELIVMLVVGAFTKIGRQLETWYDLLAAIDKLGTLLDLPLEPHGKLRVMPRGPAHVQLHQVSAKIDGQQSVAEVSADFPAGSWTAVMGAPGSGKTVLAELLCGLRQTESGFWEWNGIDARELRLESLREQIGVARQSQDVFAGTLEENIHLGREFVSGVDVKNAIRITGLQDSISQLSAGSQSEVQTGGRPLTDSQIARLMLARAIAGNPGLLLIDSTLDALSQEEARQILNSIRSEFRGTLILFTSRDSLAKLCQNLVNLGKPA